MKLFFLSIALFFLTAANAQTDTVNRPSTIKTAHRSSKNEFAQIKAANVKLAAKIQFRYFIIKAEENTYGYSIYADGNLYIQQKTIPAVAGTSGFSDTACAARTARYVIDKMKQGEIPPAITIKELKKIGVQ